MMVNDTFKKILSCISMFDQPCDVKQLKEDFIQTLKHDGL